MSPKQLGEQDSFQLERKLKEFKLKFIELFELSRDGVLILQEGDIISANESFSKLLGYDPSFLLDTAFRDYIDPLEIRYHPEKLDLLLSDKKSDSHLDTTLKKKNNEMANVELSVRNIVHNEIISKLIIVKDTTEKTQLRVMASKFEDRFTTFFQSLSEAHFILTPQGVIEDVNQAASTLLEYELDELKGKEITALIPDKNPMRRMCMQVVRETLLRKRIADVEIQLVRKDRSLVWVSVNTFVIGEVTDRHSLIDFIAKDIDRRKQAEQQARETRKRADLYLEVLTHDMTNVTQNSELTFELLRSSMNFPNDLESIIEDASWDLRRGSRMIANMRALVQLEETDLERRGIELLRCLERVTVKVTEDFPYKTLSLNIGFSSNDFVVKGHDYLEAVFYNILHNALTYTQKKGVDVKVEANMLDNGQLVRIEFIDKGPGVPDELKEHIFKRTGSPNEQIVGRGLGLTLADRVVSDLEGKIWVEDRIKGKSHLGSKFVLLLPSWCEEERPWGDKPPIIFYTSDHCVFCGTTLDTLTTVLQELSIAFDAVKLVNVDDSEAGISEDDLIALPTIEMGTVTLTGLVDENEIRSNLMNLMMTW